MRRALSAMLLAFPLAACATLHASPHAPASVVPSPAVFHAALAPYGTWTSDPALGEVWIPSPVVVGPSFAPYHCGTWHYTRAGWTWSSCYAWGWAPFHYGRWAYLPARGWAWVPGRAWGPAWVAWRAGGGYVGWAPLPPPGQSNAMAPAGSSWRFIATANLGSPGGAYVPASRTGPLLAQTRPLENRSTLDGALIERGPPASEIERVAGHAITPLPLSAVPRATPPSSTPPPPRKPSHRKRRPRRLRRILPHRPIGGDGDSLLRSGLG